MMLYYCLTFLILWVCLSSIQSKPYTVQWKPDTGIDTGSQFVGAFIFPHGAITLDPGTRNFSGVPAATPNSKEECIKLHQAMVEAASALIDARPDIILMSTPHGLTLETDYLFIGNNKAKGSAEWDGDWTNYTAEFHIEGGLTKELVQSLRDKQNPVELLRLGDEDDALNLRWAEVVPWWFINQAAIKAGVPPPSVILMGQARSRYNSSKHNIPELLKLGASTSQYLGGAQSLAGKRVAIVISSDLSHYHSSDPTSPYPYNENSTVFDQFVKNWAGIDYKSVGGDWEGLEQNLLVAGGDLVDSIGSCGYTGLVFLHGFMKEYLLMGGTELNFSSHIYYYSAPTYFGMLSASWILSG